MVYTWQAVAGLGGLASALFTVVHIGVGRIRSGSFAAAVEATWLAGREFLTCAGAAVLGWAFGVVAFERHSVHVDSSLVLSLAGALLYTTLYWLITSGGRSLVLRIMLIFVLPAATGLVVAR
jgi:hypothetical protein